MFTKTQEDKIWVIDKDKSRVEMTFAEYEAFQKEKIEAYKEVAKYVKEHMYKEKTGSATLSKEDKSTSEEGAKSNKKKKEERLETELPHSPTPVIPGGPVEASSTGERSASDETKTTPVSGGQPLQPSDHL